MNSYGSNPTVSTKLLSILKENNETEKPARTDEKEVYERRELKETNKL